MLLPPPTWRWRVGEHFVRLNQPLRELLGLNATVSCDAWRCLICAGSRAEFFQALDAAEQSAPATAAVVELCPQFGGRIQLHMRILPMPIPGGRELCARFTLLPHTSACWLHRNRRRV